MDTGSKKLNHACSSRTVFEHVTWPIKSKRNEWKWTGLWALQKTLEEEWVSGFCTHLICFVAGIFLVSVWSPLSFLYLCDVLKTTIFILICREEMRFILPKSMLRSNFWGDMPTSWKSVCPWKRFVPQIMLLVLFPVLFPGSLGVVGKMWLCSHFHAVFSLGRDAIKERLLTGIYKRSCHENPIIHVFGKASSADSVA